MRYIYMCDMYAIYMRGVNWVTINSGNGLHLLGTKLLPDLLSTGPSGTFENTKIKRLRMHWKCSSENVDHFVSILSC